MTGSLLLVLFLGAHCVHAETGYDAWLRYAPLAGIARAPYASLPASVVVVGDSVVLQSARQELIFGVRSMLGRTLRADQQVHERCIALGTLAALRSAAPGLRPPAALHEEAFWLTAGRLSGFECLIIAGGSDRGVLYGVFAVLAKIARQQSVTGLNETQQPYAPLRWIDQWDNLNGTIERGYAGPSIFFANGSVRSDLTRAAAYARLLASLGINGCTINNVNADPRVLDGGFLPQVARVADVFRPWGVKLALAVDLQHSQGHGRP